MTLFIYILKSGREYIIFSEMCIYSCVVNKRIYSLEVISLFLIRQVIYNIIYLNGLSYIDNED